LYNRRIRTTLLTSSCLSLLLLAGCSSVSVDKLWPFDDKSAATQTGAPPNATEYQCKDGKHFYLRTMDNGASVWLIYPDREVGLTKAASGSRYSNGIAVLEINGNESTLTDGTAIAYTGCKAVGK
jgi:membrane-bound inhibitor of C-type lysozyme